MSFLHASLNIRKMKYHDISDKETVDRYLIPDPREGITKEKCLINLLQGNVAADINNTYDMPCFLYLDGSACRTTNVIVETGILPSQCIPVNNDKEIFQKIKKIAPNAKYGNFKDVVKLLGDEGLKNVRYVWYDGCSTILGDIAITPIEDIEILLDYINHDFTLAITYAQRTNHPMTAYIRKRISGIPLTTEDKAKWHASKRIVKKRPIHMYRSNKRNGMTAKQQLVMIRNAILNKGFAIEQEYPLSYLKMSFCMFRLKKVFKN